MKYLKYYDLEAYLFNIVSERFHKEGYLSAFDFFCIVIWKANRAKSNIARRLLKKGYKTLDEAVKELTLQISKAPTPKEKLHVLFEWGFLLPMSSAILTVLYTEDFTIFDFRVCNELGDYFKLSWTASFNKTWAGYSKFIESVKEKTPKELSLRDKDRYLWAKSFCGDLEDDIKTCFFREKKKYPESVD